MFIKRCFCVFGPLFAVMIGASTCLASGIICKQNPPCAEGQLHCPPGLYCKRHAYFDGFDWHYTCVCKGGSCELPSPEEKDTSAIAQAGYPSRFGDPYRTPIRREDKLRAAFARIARDSAGRKTQTAHSAASNLEVPVGEIEWEEKRSSLEVGEDVERVTAKFHFTNTTKFPLTLESARATCGSCGGETTASGTGSYIPGRQGYIEVTVEFPPWERTFRRTVVAVFTRPDGETLIQPLTVELSRSAPGEKQLAGGTRRL